MSRRKNDHGSGPACADGRDERAGMYGSAGFACGEGIPAKRARKKRIMK